MSGAQLTDGDDGDTVSGRCTECGATWIGFARDAFEDRASRHVTRRHRDADPDEPLVEEFKLLGGGDDG
jgi:hypothetical protein